jgi:hypothetical protein
MLQPSMKRIGVAFVLGVVALAACEPDTRKKKKSSDDDDGGTTTTTVGTGTSTSVGTGGSTTVGTGTSTTTSTTSGVGGCNHAFEFPPSSCADCLEDWCCYELTVCGNDGVCAACLTGQQTTGCDQNGPLLDLSDCAYGYCPGECG